MIIRKKKVKTQEEGPTKAANVQNLVGHNGPSSRRQQGREGPGLRRARQPRVDERRATHHVVHEEPLWDTGR